MQTMLTTPTWMVCSRRKHSQPWKRRGIYRQEWSINSHHRSPPRNWCCLQIGTWLDPRLALLTKSWLPTKWRSEEVS